MPGQPLQHQRYAAAAGAHQHSALGERLAEIVGGKAILAVAVTADDADSLGQGNVGQRLQLAGHGNQVRWSLRRRRRNRGEKNKG